jgi:hypothetical protein
MSNEQDVLQFAEWCQRPTCQTFIHHVSSTNQTAFNGDHAKGSRGFVAGKDFSIFTLED